MKCHVIDNSSGVRAIGQWYNRPPTVDRRRAYLEIRMARVLDRATEPGCIP